MDRAPQRFTIVLDDYHVPYAGTAEDSRKFFLSEELFSPAGTGYVGLFLWKDDGTFDEVRTDKVPRRKGLPPGQAGPAGAATVLDARLAELDGVARVGPLGHEDGEAFGKHIHGLASDRRRCRSPSIIHAGGSGEHRSSDCRGRP